jgi:hypothetical protein
MWTGPAQGADRAASCSAQGYEGKKSTGQLTTITSTSLAPKSNWRMRAISFCSS